MRDELSNAKNALSSQYLAGLGGVQAQALRSIPTPEPARNIVGVAVGEKVVAGRPTGSLCITFLVRMKFGTDRVDPPDRLPDSIDGIPTDVEEVGVVAPLTADPRAHLRPLRAGASVGYRAPRDAFAMAGTAGAIVRDRQGYHILSNSHVLADEGRLSPGDPIYQPGPLDGGSFATDEVARLTRFVSFDPVGPNTVDAAIARLDRGVQADISGIEGVAPSAVGAPMLTSTVEKFGRTSGFTTGTITSVDADIRVPYDTGSFLFTRQIAIVGGTTAFSAPGDSGAVVLDRATSGAVGLLFSGARSVSFANHISEVLEILAVDLVTASS